MSLVAKPQAGRARSILRQQVYFLRRSLPYMRGKRHLAVSLVLLTSFGACLDLLAPWPLALLIDCVLGDKNFPPWLNPVSEATPFVQIVFAVGLGLVLRLISSGVTVLAESVGTRLELGMVLEFRSDVFQHGQRLSLAFHASRRAGQFVYQTNYLAHYIGSAVSSLLPTAQSLLTLVGMFYVVYQLNPTLALLAATVVPFLYLSMHYYARHIEPELYRVRELEGASMSIVHESMTMIRVVVAFGREALELQRFRELAKVGLDARVRITIKQTLFSLIVGLITATGTALVLAYGAHKVLSNVLTIGELLVVFSYLSAVYKPLEAISHTLTNLQQNYISVEACFALLDTPIDLTDKPDAQRMARANGAVTFDEVSFAYEGREGTLEDVSFEVKPGELVGIVGPTGAGKSTLLSLIPRFMDTHRGRVLLDGADIRDFRLADVRSQVSVVLQEPMLFMATIYENILYGRLDATRDEVVEAARAANIHDFIESLPAGYETMIGEGGQLISGGERQRISVARAFLRDAPILLLDEPTSSIDSKTESVIIEALDRLMVGRTTFLIAHRLSTIRRANRILVMNHGHLVEQGTHDELLAAGGLYRTLHDVQADRALPSPTRMVESRTALADPCFTGAPSSNGTTPVALSVPGRRPTIVLLGMMTKIPVAGVIWQTIHYLLGFERLGFDVWYVEAHARTPSMFMRSEHDDGSARAADFIARTMRRIGLADRWAYHALHDANRCFGLTVAQLNRLYAEADLVINLHGSTVPTEEQAASGRLVYVETDPVCVQVELYDGEQHAIDYLEPHCALFTFGENYGNADCLLPVSDRFTFLPTRQPVLLDQWAGHGVGKAEMFTTIGNWRQDWRPVTINGQTYQWSKHLEWAKLHGLPGRTAQRFELALSGYVDEDRLALESDGWLVRDALDFSLEPAAYRAYVGSSRGELTVAKDQNVRLRSGWFSDRSATYLAAGRPVVTQDTGFGNVLPTGEGLFAFSTSEDALAAVEAINGDYERHRRGALEVAREHFAHDRVLGTMLDAVGVRAAPPQPPARQRAQSPADTDSSDLPLDLILTTVGRKPTMLDASTVARSLSRPVSPPSLAPTPVTPEPGTELAASIVVVTYNQLAVSRLCLESLLTHTATMPIEVIVVDNASTDLTPGYLATFAATNPCVRLITNDTNRGFAPAANQGLAAASGAVLVILNNDTIVTPGWLEGLVEQLDDPTIGLVGPTTNQAPNEARVDTSYSTYGELLLEAAGRAHRHEGEARDLAVVTMFCAAMRRSTYELVGPLDERFEVGLFEDDDYSMRVRRAGFRTACAEGVLIHHFGEASFGDLVPTGEYGRLFASNRQRFEDKWHVSWESHRQRNKPAYEALTARFHQLVANSLPDDAVVAVISKGDERLMQLGARHAIHFPCGERGEYAGHYPLDSLQAIEQLEALRSKGATYVAIPATSRWWLDHYDGLAAHLDANFDLVADDEHTALIFGARPRTDRVAESESEVLW